MKPVAKLQKNIQRDLDEHAAAEKRFLGRRKAISSLLLKLLVAAAFAALFAPVLFKLEMVQFSNDAPLGVVMADARGKSWRDGNWFGFSGGSDMETVAGFMRTNPMFFLCAAVAIAFIVIFRPKLQTVCRCYASLGVGYCIMVLPVFFIPNWLPAVVNPSIGFAILYFFGYFALSLAIDQPPDLKCPPTTPKAAAEVLGAAAVVVAVAVAAASAGTFLVNKL